jgi:uncharacterized protein (DUF2252 family)
LADASANLSKPTSRANSRVKFHVEHHHHSASAASTLPAPPPLGAVGSEIYVINVSLISPGVVIFLLCVGCVGYCCFKNKHKLTKAKLRTTGGGDAVRLKAAKLEHLQKMLAALESECQRQKDKLVEADTDTKPNDPAFKSLIRLAAEIIQKKKAKELVADLPELFPVAAPTAE